MRDRAYENGIMKMAEIGASIKQTRKALKLRQSELASVAGIGTRTLSEIENGKETAQIGLVLRVLDLLAIDVELTPMTTTNTESK